MGRLGRREFLMLSGAALTGFAGCLDGRPGTTVETPTPGPTPTATPTQTPSVPVYGWEAATLDGARYSLQNTCTALITSGNGLPFPANQRQLEEFESRVIAILGRSGIRRHPVRDAAHVVAPFTEGDPGYVEEPVFDLDGGRRDGETLRWERSRSAMTVSPASLAWTHLAGVTWAKNLERHFGSPSRVPVPRFRAQMFATLAQHGIRFALVDGNLLEDEDGDDLQMVSGYRRGEGVVNEEARPLHHTAMLWFLSEMVSLARGGWFGYVNPRPLLKVERLEELMNGVARTTMALFPVESLGNLSMREMGEMLAAIGVFGRQTRDQQLLSRAVDYANALAGAVEENVEGSGWVGSGALNQAATQGMVIQGLVWASRLGGVDYRALAERMLRYLLEELWDPDAGTFASGEGDTVYTISALDAADVVGGLNAGIHVLGRDDVEQVFGTFFDQTINRGRLQRADLSVLSGGESRHDLPHPGDAGGPFGKAPVFNGEVEYDTERDEWRVTDDRFRAYPAMALACQTAWMGRIGERPYPGFGIPGRSDTPP